ncbi:MBOAT family O-acyltransferase [Planctomycetota bacterium]
MSLQIHFFGIVLLFAGICYLGNRDIRKGRCNEILLMAANFLFLVSLLDLFTLYFYILMTGGVWICAKIMIYLHARRSGARFFLRLLIFGFVLLLATTKYQVLIDYRNNLIELIPFQLKYDINDINHMIGFSYFTFRSIQLILLCYWGEEARADMLRVFQYLFFFPSFLLGPITRYEDFQAGPATSTLSPRELYDIVWRIVLGLFKKLVIADNLLAISITYVNVLDIGEVSPLALIAGINFCAWSLYMDFSGYTDLAIGLGRLCGYRVPENFNAPFFQGNITNFWKNWHMSLTSWLNEFLYLPITNAFRRRNPGRQLWVAIFTTVPLFCIIGLWHGDGLNWLVLGFYHGVLVSGHKLYSVILRSKILHWKKYRSYRFLSWLVTYNLVLLSFPLFAYPWDAVLKIYGRLFGF